MDNVIDQAGSSRQSRSHLGETAASAPIFFDGRVFPKLFHQDDELFDQWEPHIGMDEMLLEGIPGMEGVHAQTAEEQSIGEWTRGLHMERIGMGMDMRCQEQGPLAAPVTPSIQNAFGCLSEQAPHGQLALPDFGSIWIPGPPSDARDNRNYFSQQGNTLFNDILDISRPSTGTSMRPVCGSPHSSTSPYIKESSPESDDSLPSFFNPTDSFMSAPDLFFDTPGSFSSTPSSFLTTPGSLFSSPASTYDPLLLTSSPAPEGVPIPQSQASGKLPLPPGNGNTPSRYVTSFLLRDPISDLQPGPDQSLRLTTAISVANRRRATRIVFATRQAFTRSQKRMTARLLAQSGIGAVAAQSFHASAETAVSGHTLRVQHARRDLRTITTFASAPGFLKIGTNSLRTSYHVAQNRKVVDRRHPSQWCLQVYG